MTISAATIFIGFKRGLGEKADKMIVSQQTYNTSDPTVDSQIVSMKAAGANVLMIFSVPKFAAQAIRKAYDIDWHPQEFVSSVGSSIAGAIRPAGFEAAKGIISAAYQKDPADPQWRDDPEMKAWNAWMDKYNPRVDKSDYYAPYGYNIGHAVVELLKAVRRQSHAREYHGQGHASRHGAAAVVAGHQADVEPDRSPPDQADAAGALQRRALRAVLRRARERVMEAGARPQILAFRGREPSPN